MLLACNPTYLDHLFDHSEGDVVTVDAKDISQDIKAHLVVVEVIVDNFVEEFTNSFVLGAAMGASNAAGVSFPLIDSLYEHTRRDVCRIDKVSMP